MGYDLHFELYGNTKRNTGGLIEAIVTELAPEYKISGTVAYGIGGTLDYRENDFLQGRLKEETDHILESNKFMIFTIGSPNDGPRPHQINACIRGSLGMQSIYQAIVGPLKFYIPFEQFRPSDVTMLTEVNEPPSSWDELLIKDNSGYDYEAVYRTFISLTGVNRDWVRPYGLEHALAFANYADAHEAHMVYHANIDGFAKDFEVLRHRYWEGSSPAILYSDDLNPPKKEDLDRQVGRIVNFDPIVDRISDGYMLFHYRHHYSKEQFHQFFHRIDDGVIAYFRSLSAEKLQFLVELAAEETGRRWLPAAAGNGGAVVGPLHQDDGHYLRVLIDFYEYLLDY